MVVPTRAQAGALLGCCFVALLSGLPNGFNNISDDVKRDLGASPIFESVLTGVGVAGLQFTLLGGLFLDKYGPVRTVVGAGGVVVAGHIAMSFAGTPTLVFAAYLLVGFGSGTTFISALGTSISLGNPLGIGLVSLSMSLSMTVDVVATDAYAVHVCESIDHPACWRQYARLYAVMCAAAFATGTLLLHLFLEKATADTAALASDASSSKTDMESPGGGLASRIAPSPSSRTFRSSSMPPAASAAAPADSGAYERMNTSSGASVRLRGGVADAAFDPVPGADSGSPARARHPYAAGGSYGAVADAARGRARSACAAERKRRASTNLGPAEAHRASKVLSHFFSSLRVFTECFFWCLFLGDLFGVGAGIFVVTNVNQLWSAFGGANDFTWTNAVVIGFSVCNAIGNVGSPVLSDALFHRGIMSRAKFLALFLVLFAADFLAIGVVASPYDGASSLPSTATKALFTILLSLVGLGFGTFLVLLPTSVSDAYGLDSFGTILSYMQLGVAVFAVAVPAVTTVLYDAYASYDAAYFGFSGALFLSGACMLAGTSHQPDHMRLINDRIVSEDDDIVSHQMW